MKDINPGSSDGVSFGSNVMIAYRGKIYFQADTPEFGTELWVSDGTEAGTNILIDLAPGNVNSFPRNLTILGDLLLFSANTPGVGEELYRTDGTAEGTFLLKDINPGTSGGFSSFVNEPRNNFIRDGIFYFIGNTSEAGQELWRTDGTEAGTVLLKDINPGSNGSQPSDFAFYQGMVYFGASGEEGFQLWRTDGTTEGTTQVTSIVPFRFNGPLPRQLTVFRDSLYFNGDFIVEGDMFRTDGTAEGTERLRDFSTRDTGNSNAGGLSVRNFDDDLWKQWHVINDYLIFPVVDGDGADLWRMDGSLGSIQPIVDFEEVDSSFDPAMSSFVNVDGKLLYYLDNLPGRQEQSLWQTDGSAEGTYPLFSPIEDSFRFTGFPSPFYWKGRLYMSVLAEHPDYESTDILDRSQLWVTDGTSDFSQTYPIIRSDTLLALEEPYGYTALGDTLYFFAGTSHQGYELHRMTAALTTDELVISSPECADVANGQISFRINGGVAPYTSQGMVLTDSTLRLTDLAAGTYPITITDAIGTVFQDTITLTGPSALLATVTSTGERTDPFGQGSADIQVSGGTGPYRYEWPDGMTQDTSFRDSLVAGIYSVVIIDANGCRLLQEVNIEDLTSIRELSDLGVSIFPNPVGDHLTLDANSTDKKIVALTVYDYMGRQISQSKWRTSPTFLQLDSAKLPSVPGPFLLLVTFHDGTTGVARLIRQ